MYRVLVRIPSCVLLTLMAAAASPQPQATAPNTTTFQPVPPRSAQSQPAVMRSGRHYRVICHFANEAVAAAALKTVEAVWPIADELFGVQSPPPPKPLDVHIYRTAAEYEKAEAELTKGRFRENLSCSDDVTRSSLVALQPPCDEDTLARIGLSAQTRRVLAHEAAHLYCYATLPASSSHPVWLKEGLAEWVADEVMTRTRRSPGDEQDPYTATYMVAAGKLNQAGKLPSCTAILKDELDSPTYTGYARRWLFFRFMQTGAHRDAWSKVLAEARRLGGGADYPQRLHAAIERQLGAEVFGRLDAEFAGYVRSLQPQWDEVYRTLDTGQSPWVQMAFDTNAIAWRTQPAGSSPYQVAGALQILPAGLQQLNVLLGRCDQGFISVAFKAGAGVTLFHYWCADDRWEQSAWGGCDIAPRRWIPFRIECSGGAVRVLVNDREVLKASPGAEALSGPWGLGAQATSAGLWRDVLLNAQSTD